MKSLIKDVEAILDTLSENQRFKVELPPDILERQLQVILHIVAHEVERVVIHNRRYGGDMVDGIEVKIPIIDETVKSVIDGLNKTRSDFPNHQHRYHNEITPSTILSVVPEIYSFLRDTIGVTDVIEWIESVHGRTQAIGIKFSITLDEVAGRLTAYHAKVLAETHLANESQKLDAIYKALPTLSAIHKQVNTQCELIVDKVDKLTVGIDQLYAKYSTQPTPPNSTTKSRRSNKRDTPMGKKPSDDAES